jgi:hypothetical protein
MSGQSAGLADPAAAPIAADTIDTVAGCALRIIAGIAWLREAFFARPARRALEAGSAGGCFAAAIAVGAGSDVRAGLAAVKTPAPFIDAGSKHCRGVHQGWVGAQVHAQTGGRVTVAVAEVAGGIGGLVAAVSEPASVVGAARHAVQRTIAVRIGKTRGCQEMWPLVAVAAGTPGINVGASGTWNEVTAGQQAGGCTERAAAAASGAVTGRRIRVDVLYEVAELAGL